MASGINIYNLLKIPIVLYELTYRLWGLRSWEINIIIRILAPGQQEG